MNRYTKTTFSHNNISKKNPLVGVQEKGSKASSKTIDVLGLPTKVARPLVKKPIEEMGKAPPTDIDQSAEEFIMKFRNQLKIQRMESIDNYHKMLARGT
ncbi:hypothetical protein CTI12_AA224230 [Artemisia annua]|uniref:Uncharacterized protein n=1 Tax=Artemisia annua TaxID=35608 RepID=A0A2U1NK08_ARTAN|nr:hypothetical protein CTI12_AA224230 [Artemisia annua]